MKTWHIVVVRQPICSRQLSVFTFKLLGVAARFKKKHCVTCLGKARCHCASTRAGADNDVIP